MMRARTCVFMLLVATSLGCQSPASREAPRAPLASQPPVSAADFDHATAGAFRPASQQAEQPPAAGQPPTTPSQGAPAAPAQPQAAGQAAAPLPPPGSQPAMPPAQRPEPLPAPIYPFTPVPFDSTLPPQARELGGGSRADVRPLELRAVKESIYVAYPGLEAAMRELDIAAGRELGARGEFDLKLKAESWSEALGFYRYYTNALKLEQALWQGGGLVGQYRNGSGKFPVWYGELETNDGGEFKLALLQPLLRNRAIDGRRADIMQATLRRQQVEPAVQALLLQLVQAGADAYWTWVAAGRAYDVQRDLLRVTIERNAAYEARVAAGDLPRIELVQNQRLIAQREAKMVEAERKLQQAAIKLSLYLRDEMGQPLVPSPASLPPEFPEPSPPNAERLGDDIALAVQSRPELRELALLRQQEEVDLALGENQTLPALDAMVGASKDVGGSDKPIDDKGPFELEAAMLFDVPVQRRKAQGKIREAQGKLAQIAARRRLAENRIVIEVQDAVSALATSYQRWQRARENTLLSRQLVQAERQRFDAQDSDLLRVAIQESAAIEAELTEIEALADYYRARAAFLAAIAADPLQDR